MDSSSSEQTAIQDGGQDHGEQRAEREDITNATSPNQHYPAKNVIQLDTARDSNGLGVNDSASTSAQDDVVVIGEKNPEVKHIACPLCELSFKVSLQNTFKLVIHLHEHVFFGIPSHGNEGRTKFSYQRGQYHCSSCRLSTKLRFIFREHMRHHILKYPYYCGECKTGISDITSYLQHTKLTHGGEFRQLKVCYTPMLDGVMEKLGPHAPPTDDIVAVQHQTPNRVVTGEVRMGTASKPIQIADEDDMKDLIEETEHPLPSGSRKDSSCQEQLPIDQSYPGNGDSGETIDLTSPTGLNTSRSSDEHNDSFDSSMEIHAVSLADVQGSEDVPNELRANEDDSVTREDEPDFENEMESIVNYQNNSDEGMENAETENQPEAESPSESCKQREMAINAGHYAVVNDSYKCITCKFMSKSTQYFRLHVYRHIHGSSGCSHAPSNEVAKYWHCKILNGVMAILSAKMTESNAVSTDVGSVQPLAKLTQEAASEPIDSDLERTDETKTGEETCEQADTSCERRNVTTGDDGERSDAFSTQGQMVTEESSSATVQASELNEQDDAHESPVKHSDVTENSVTFENSEVNETCSASCKSSDITGIPNVSGKTTDSENVTTTDLQSALHTPKNSSTFKASSATELGSVNQAEETAMDVDNATDKHLEDTAIQTTTFEPLGQPEDNKKANVNDSNNKSADIEPNLSYFKASDNRMETNNKGHIDCDLVQRVAPSKEDDFVSITDDDDDYDASELQAVEKKKEEETCSRLKSYEGWGSRKTLQQLMDHLRLHKEAEDSRQLVKSYKCGQDSCDFAASDEDSFQIHCLVRHHMLAVLKCGLCSNTYGDIGALAIHMTQTHVHKHTSQSNKGHFKCAMQNCHLGFNQLGELHSHLAAEHANESEYGCCFCERHFSDIQELITHINAHLKKVMKCPYCEQNFALKREILSHLRDRHPSEPRKINMSIRIIPRPAPSEVSPPERAPQSSVTEAAKAEKQLPSSDIRADVSVSSVNEHAAQKSLASEADDGEAIDSEDVPATSAEVRLDGSFVQMPLQCRQCNYRCNAFKTMSVHEAIHKNPRPTNNPYLCDVCPYSVNSKHVFQNHMQHHEGEHPIRYYICMHCHWSSNKMTLTEDHILSKHPKDPFKFEVQQVTVAYMEGMCLCPFCRGSYIWRSEFIRHIQKMHNSETAFYQHICGIPDKDLDMVRRVCAQYANSRRRIHGGGFGPVSLKTGTADSQQNSTSGKDHLQIYRFHCDFCSFSTNEQHIYARHSKTHTGSVGEETAESDASSSISDLSHADQHQDGPPHLGIKILRCSICPYTTTSYKNLANHKTTHTKNANIQEGYACPYCKYKGSNIKGATYHIHRYHPNKNGPAIRISGGKLLKERELECDTVKRVAKKSTRPSSQKSPDTPVVYQRMGSWTTNYQSPYATTSTVQHSITPQEVPALPKSLTSASLAEFEQNLPSEMIFKSPVKCPKCNFSNKVRYNLIRHIKTHVSDGSSGDSPRLSDGVRSPASSLATQITEFADNGDDEDDEDDDDEDFMNESTDISLNEARYSQFCTKVPCMDLYRCNACVFMHANPAKVAHHFENKHGTKCSLCDFEGSSREELDNHHEQIHARASSPASMGMDHSADEVLSGVTVEDSTNGKYEEERKFMEANADKYMEKSNGNAIRCSVCGYEQEGTSALRRHIWAVHIKYYPYACKYCDVAMVEVNKLKRHLNRRHPGLPPIIVKQSAPYSSEVAKVKKEPGLDSAESSSSHNDNSLPVLVKQEPLEPLADDISLDRSDPNLPTLESEASPSLGDGLPRKSITVKRGIKLHKCAYCSYISRWSAIDTKRHVFSQHLRRREYTCRYCNFEGNKPGSVRSHLARAHPHVSGGIKHRRGEMECVKPISEDGETAAYAVVTDDDVPILDEASLLDEDIRSMLTIFKPLEQVPNEQISTPSKPRVENTLKVKPSFVQRIENKVSNKPIPDKVPLPSPNSASSGRRNDIIWRCKLCGLLGNKIKVKMHVLARHMKLKPLRCPYCCMYIWKKDAMRRHVMIDHPDKEVAFVNVLTENLELICRHIESVSGAPDISSQGWGKGAENKSLGLTFTASGSSEKAQPSTPSEATSSGQKKNVELWRCKLCGLVDSRIRHRYHVAVHHLKLHPVQCPHCHENFWKWELAKKHIETEHVGLDGTLINMLSKHIDDIEKNIERVDSSISVDIVRAMEQTTEEEVENPLSKLKASKDIMMRCKICGAQGNRAKLRYHIICHHLKLKPVQCGHCNQYFYKNHLAMRHIMREHRGLEKVVRHVTTEKAQYLESQMELVESPQTKSFSHLVSDATNSSSSSTSSEASPSSLDLLVNDKGKSGLENFKPRLEGNEYQCDKCPYRTSVLVALKAHHKLHQMFQCCYCPFKATLASKVQTHCLARHKGKAVRYQHLDMVSNPTLEQQSVKEVKDDKSVEQDASQIAPQDLFSSLNVRQKKAFYGNQSKKDGPFRCSYCSSICLYRENMKRHIRSRHPNMSYNFRELNASEKKQAGPSGRNLPSNLHGISQKRRCREVNEDGMDGVRNTNEYRCNICNYKTNDVAPTNMKHHVMVHFNYRPFKCAYCTRFNAVRGYSVKKHCRSAHPGKQEVFLEETDEDMEAKVLESFVRIKSGKKTHHPLRKRTMYRCVECGLKQDAKRDIVRHICRHINYRPCWCALCDYQEPDNGTMKKHFRMKHRGVAIRYNMRTDPIMEKRLNDMLDASTHLLISSPGSDKTPNSTSPRAASGTVAANTRGATQQEMYSTIANVLDVNDSDDAENTFDPPKPLKQVGTARKSTCNYPRSTAEWNKHLKKGTLIFRCPLCEYYHLRKAKVSEHMLLRHGQKRLKCALCDAQYLYPSHISKHFNHKHPGMRVQSVRINEGIPPPVLPEIKTEVYQGYGKESLPAPLSIDTNKRSPVKRPLLDTSFSPGSKKRRTSWIKEEMSPVRPDTPSTESDSSSAQVFFEGQPFDMPIEADEEGYYHCGLCKYSTTNKEHYKMHAVSHNPPRWQCGYCDKKYVMQFRVRRHCVARHKNEPIVMIDLTSGERFYYSRQDRCRTGSLQNISSPSNSEASSVSVTPSQPSPSMGIKYCCHLCSFVTYQEFELSQHIRLDHFGPKQEPPSDETYMEWDYSETVSDDTVYDDPKLEGQAVVVVTDIGPLLAADAGHLKNSASLSAFGV